MFSDIKHVDIWLKRIEIDNHLVKMILRIFHDSRKCSRDASSPSKRDSTSIATRRKKAGNRSNGGGSGSGSVSSGHEYSWYEWIEPITVYARHPFSYLQCQPKKGRKNNLKLSSSYVPLSLKKKENQLKIPFLHLLIQIIF
jgi:hypothetical protein